MITIGVDIDRTLFCDTNQAAAMIARRCGIKLTKQEIALITCLGDFQAHPKVRQYVQQSKEHLRYIKRVNGEVLESRELIEQMPPIPGAVEAMQQLARECRIVYVTCRTPDLMPLTTQRLREYGFPSPDAVYSCAFYHHKYLHAFEVADADEGIVIIDDMAQEVVESFPDLIKEYRHVAESIVSRLAVVQFYTKKSIDVSWPIPFEMMRLSSWHDDEIQRLCFWLFGDAAA